MEPDPGSDSEMATLSARLFTLSNGLTSLRLVAAPFFFCMLAGEIWSVAFVLFWLAVASDLLDGRLARARGETSALGGLLDHASDAIFVSFGQFALVATGRAPAFLPLLILVSFLQYALDSRILAGRSLRASPLGRWNGILYFLAPGVVVTREVLALSLPSDDVIRFLGWGLVFSTLISMLDRLIALTSGGRRDLTPR